MSNENKTTGVKDDQMQAIIIEAVEHKIEEVGRRLILEGKKAQKSWSKLTAKRLYGYPLLKKNIERYQKDIEDIRKENMGKSKSIVEFYAHSGGGEKPDIEDLRAAKIRIIEMKIARDQQEIKEIEVALASIKDDEYYPIIEMKFFQQKSHEEIAEAIPCGVATVSRQLGRLLDIINITLYGADAIAH